MGQIKSSWVTSSQVRTGQVEIFLDPRLFGPKICLDPKFKIESIQVKLSQDRSSQFVTSQVKSENFFDTKYLLTQIVFFIVSFSDSQFLSAQIR